MIKYFKGIFFVFALYFSSFLGSIFIQAPSFPLLLLRPSWFRWWNDRWIEIWLIMPPVSDFWTEHFQNRFLICKLQYIFAIGLKNKRLQNNIIGCRFFCTTCVLAKTQKAKETKPLDFSHLLSSNFKFYEILRLLTVFFFHFPVVLKNLMSSDVKYISGSSR